MTTLPTVYQQFIHKSRYARWLPNEKRREEWHETVSRYFDFFEKQIEKNCMYKIDKKTREYLENKVLNLEVMPSMRALMTAGPALEKENIAGYNCSYIPVDHPKAFDEILYVLMCGTGVGFSVEKKYTEHLPSVADDFHDTESVVVVRDSKLGWAKHFGKSLRYCMPGKSPGGIFLTCDLQGHDFTLSVEELQVLHHSWISSTLQKKPLLKRRAED